MGRSPGFSPGWPPPATLGPARQAAWDGQVCEARWLGCFFQGQGWG